MCFLHSPLGWSYLKIEKKDTPFKRGDGFVAPLECRTSTVTCITYFQTRLLLAHFAQRLPPMLTWDCFHLTYNLKTTHIRLNFFSFLFLSYCRLSCFVLQHTLSKCFYYTPFKNANDINTNYCCPKHVNKVIIL